MIMQVAATNGRRFEVRSVGQTTWGDEKLEFTFELGWANGKLEFVCSKDRLNKLEASLDKYRSEHEVSHSFINEDGNLEIAMKGLPTGLIDFQVIAIPKMTEDDRMEFGFEGTVEN